jgi:GNAT superfamily N-acetyltransferase
MQAITQAQLAEMKDRFLPDRPGPLIGLHIIHTGYGTAHVDRWPEPNVLLVNTAGNYSLCGDPDYLNVANLQANVSGFVEAPPSFLSGLKAAFPDVLAWDRVILQLAERPTVTSPDNSRVRRLDKGDAAALRALSAEVSWVAKTWGGTDGLAESGYAWGAFVENRLVSIACTFFVGETCEDIGVATEPAFRRQGLSTACVEALCEDIFNRGRKPSWTTSPDNTASLRVAKKLGFVVQHQDFLYIVNMQIPSVG